MAESFTDYRQRKQLILADCSPRVAGNMRRNYFRHTRHFSQFLETTVLGTHRSLIKFPAITLQVRYNGEQISRITRIISKTINDTLHTLIHWNRYLFTGLLAVVTKNTILYLAFLQVRKINKTHTLRIKAEEKQTPREIQIPDAEIFLAPRTVKS